MPSRRAYVISLGLLLLVGAPAAYTRWRGRSFPADTTVEGAYLRVVYAVDNDALGDAFAYLETEAQWACHTTFDYHKKVIDLVSSSYPEPERSAALARYPEAAASRDAPALFARLARSRGWEARLRRDLSGIARVEEQGERATLETARGTRYAFRRRENGIWGMTMFTGELRLEAERAARDALLVERAAADYRAAAPAGSAQRKAPLPRPPPGGVAVAAKGALGYEEGVKAPPKGRVLVVDDEPAMVELLCDALPPLGYEVVGRQSGDEALAAFASDSFDVVLTDLAMRRMGGIELCRRVVEGHPDVPVVVLTAFGNFESAVEAIRAGAYDFLQKPLQLEALGLALDKALRHRALHGEVKRLRLAVERARGFGDVVGESPVMQKVYDLLARVCDSDASVLLTGESGTGKEIVARALHRAGRRRDGPFVAINCAAMPETLLESELFGHAKGAFTDARGARKGLFVEASGGTLFLDEIGDMPLGLQPKLLRALQERRVRPVGSNAEQPFDARVVSATNRDLEAAVEAHAFREDLYYRLNVIHVPLPPLRARGGDLLILAQKFISAFAERAGKAVVGLSPPAAERLVAYNWPGNVRELQNVIERGVALARYDHISPDDLPERVVDYRSQPPPTAPSEPAELLSMEEVERRHIARVLSAFGGNKTLAARTLGYDRTTLYRKLERYGLLDAAPAKPSR